MLDLLLELVFIHEEIYSSAKGELEAMMKALLEKLSRTFLECLKEIDTFNAAGALQALVEADFIKHTLARYLSLTANRTFSAAEQILTSFLTASSEGTLQNHICGHYRLHVVIARSHSGDMCACLCFCLGAPRELLLSLRKCTTQGTAESGPSGRSHDV